MSEMPGFCNNFRNNIHCVCGGGGGVYFFSFQGFKWTLFFGFAYTMKLQITKPGQDIFFC